MNIIGKATTYTIHLYYTALSSIHYFNYMASLYYLLQYITLTYLIVAQFHNALRYVYQSEMFHGVQSTLHRMTAACSDTVHAMHPQCEETPPTPDAVVAMAID